VVYQVYPRSFRDTDGDGVGDLPGIVQGLDYLAWLGVDALWVSPFYRSPMADFGYDVADHTDVDPLFGTLADADRLVAEAHRRGLRVLLDYVPNHTSDRHPWFLASRAARVGPYRDWYLWRDPAPDGGPPTNWRSVFGGSAWTLDPGTGQYYCHTYLAEQPDLNWRHPGVRAAMLDVLRFWLARGVDGFRVDALRQLVKDDRWRDNPPNPRHRPEQGPYRALEPVYTADRPEVLDMVALMRATADAWPDRVLVGELYLPLERLVAYYGRDGRDGVHLPFNFHLMQVPWRARAIADLIERYEAALPPGAWPNWVLGNHDRPRLASRVGPAQARVAAMLLLTLRGTPTLYQGDELGLRDVPIPPERVRDPWERNVPGLGLGRDPARAPMPWDDAPQAGFTAGEPWLPLGPDARAVCVAAQRGDARSTLTLYRRLLALRRASPALAVGAWAGLPAGEDVLAYRRWHGAERWTVLLNLTGRPCDVAAGGGPDAARVVLSSHLDREGEAVTGAVRLRADEGLLLRERGDAGREP
jgi:alpha-glucosidase